MNKVILITGGARSGKSSRALALCDGCDGKIFMATAEAIDEEMTRRITKHQAERGPNWTTIEEPLDLADGIERAAKEGSIVVVDCLTVWIGNLMHHLKKEDLIENAICRFLNVLDDPPLDIVLVTNEVGFGIVPADQKTRAYRDLLGGLNQRIAELASSVQLMICGIPMLIKGVSPF